MNGAKRRKLSETKEKVAEKETVENKNHLLCSFLDDNTLVSMEQRRDKVSKVPNGWFKERLF